MKFADMVDRFDCNLRVINISICYRPQRSCGKVMFSQAFVILSTEGGGVHPRADTPLARHPHLRRHPPPSDGHYIGRYASLLECILVLQGFHFLRTMGCMAVTFLCFLFSVCSKSNDRVSPERMTPGKKRSL